MIEFLSTLSSCKQSGVPAPPSIHRLFIAGIVFSVFIALAACTQKPEPTLEVKQFVELTRRDFQTLEKRLSPLLVQTDPGQKVDEAVKKFLSDPETMAGRPNLGIAVLDGDMNYIAGRSVSAKQPDAAPIRTSLSDFSYLKDLFKAAGKGIAQQPLYYQNREIFTVCSAIRAGEKADAFVCLFYDAKSFRRMFGFGEQVLAGIDFSG
jgi:hypothetical protein